MKQIFIYILTAIALFFSLSCSKAEHESGVTAPGKRPLTFTADITATKTTLGDDWSVSWAEGDEVSILWKGGRAEAPAVISDGKVYFSAVVDEADEYYAVYPSDIKASIDDSGELSFEIPSTQSGKFEDCAIITAKTTLESLDFGTFKSAVSLVRFVITGDSYGQVVFSPEGISPVTVTTPSAGTYFLAIPAGIVLPGVKFVLGSKGTAASGNPVSLNAGDVLCINTPLEEYMEIEGDLYINDVASLITALSGDGSAINGHTIHVKAGTYDLSSSGMGLKLEYKSPVTVEISGEDGTIFTTSQEGDEGYIMAVGANVNLILEGITFTGASHSGAGGALWITGGTHKIKNCIFRDNACTSTTSDRVGGAVYIGGTSSADITGCTFTGNNVGVTGGGALAFFAATTSRVLGCTFKGNNTGKIGNGGAILQKKAGNILYIADCTFEGNACANNGPDIFTSAGAALLLYNNTFANPAAPASNSPNRGLLRANAPVFAANCTFAMEVDESEEGAGCNNGLLAFGQGNNNVIVNNLMLSNAGYSMGVGASYTGTTTRNAVSYGYNVYNQAPKINLTDNGNETDIKGIKTADICAGTGLSETGLLEWDGPAEKLPGFSMISASRMEEVIKAYPVYGTEFFDWLVEKGIFDKDAAGNSRGTEGWWPGAYQK